MARARPRGRVEARALRERHSFAAGESLARLVRRCGRRQLPAGGCESQGLDEEQRPARDTWCVSVYIRMYSTVQLCDAQTTVYRTGAATSTTSRRE